MKGEKERRKKGRREREEDERVHGTGRERLEGGKGTLQCQGDEKKCQRKDS